MNKQQEQVDAWFKEKDWPYWAPMSILARLMEETGELARLINHLYGEKPKRKEEGKQELEEEIGDILFTLICLANSHGINLDEAAEKSLTKVKDRDKNRY